MANKTTLKEAFELGDIHTLRRYAARCTTHHHACDCRELRVAEEITSLRNQLDELKAAAVEMKKAFEEERLFSGIECHCHVGYRCISCWGTAAIAEINRLTK